MGVCGEREQVRSENVPTKNLGPVYKTVGDTLMKDVMDPTHDVVLHFFSDST